MDLIAKTSFSAENQRSIIKYLFLCGLNAAEIHRDLVKVLDKEDFNQRTVRYWCSKFKKGEWSVEDHRGGDFTSDSRTEEGVAIIAETFEKSRAWTMRSL